MSDCILFSNMSTNSSQLGDLQVTIKTHSRMFYDMVSMLIRMRAQDPDFSGIKTHVYIRTAFLNASRQRKFETSSHRVFHHVSDV